MIDKTILIQSDGRASANLSPKYFNQLKLICRHLNGHSEAFSEYVFNYINDITILDVCECCGVEKKRFISIKQGYAKFCSTKCSNKYNAKIQSETKTNFPKEVWSNIINKTKQTNLEKYGCENVGQNQEIKERIKAGNLEKYGVEWSFQSDNNKEKTKEYNLEKYGCENNAQRNIVDKLPFLNDKEWILEEYKTKTATQIADDLGVDKSTMFYYFNKHDIEFKSTTGYSYMSIEWLNYIMEKENIFIQHGANGGEFKIPKSRYSADGYCKETNTIYEFHGDCYHGNPSLFDSEYNCHPFNREISAGELYKNTRNRENKIKELGYNLVVIWENEYKILYK